MANVPNFGDLASQQNQANNAASNLTNQANRPNQYNPMGSITWGRDAGGNWTQSSALGGQAQGLWDQSFAGQGALAGQIGGGINYGSAPAMPQVGGYNQEVINAWQGLQQPELDRNATAQRQRLAAQGVTMGSNISNTSERNLGNVSTDARNKAILAGYTQGNTEFDQALRARAQGTGEAEKSYDATIRGSGALGTMRDSLNPNKWAANVPGSANYLPQTIYGAAQDQFNAQRQNENADIARQQAQTGSYVDALRAAGGISGIGQAASAAAPYVQDAWSGIKGYFSNGGNDWDWTGSPEYF